jgi:glycosyltransferase involved in cell wall biosynthesis
MAGEMFRLLCFDRRDRMDYWVRLVDRLAASLVGPGVGLVIGREDAAEKSFAAAHARGISCLYDLPIAYYETVRSVMRTEIETFPDALSDSAWTHIEYAAARCRRKLREVLAADHVLVPSLFVRDSLVRVGVEPARISVIPFGCSPVGSAESARTGLRGRGAVVLYVGHLSLRKGIPRLLRVWKRLGAYRTHTLRLVGSLHLPPRFLESYRGVFEYVPQVPRVELAKHYGLADFFVMPSAAEGMAVVITEALSHGLPLVASSHSGAGGFLTDGCEGLLYQFGDDDGLGAALEYLLSNPARVAEMRCAAYQLAKSWTWPHYRERFIQLVARLLLDGKRRSAPPG